MLVRKVKSAMVFAYPMVNRNMTREVKLMCEALFADNPKNTFNLVCTGTSGLYVSTIMKVLYPHSFTIMYKRKDNDCAHCGDISTHDEDGVFVFVDDFIAEGKTFQRLNLWIKELGFEITHVLLMSPHSGVDAKENFLDPYDVTNLLIGVDS